MLDREAAARPLLSAGIVQANISRYGELARERGTYRAARGILDAHFQLSRQAFLQAPIDLLVWPETVYPTTFGAPKTEEGAALDREIAGFVASSRVPLVFGAYDVDEEGEFNAAVFLEPGRDGRFEFETYRKAWLFPLTERVPRLLDREGVRAWLPWLGTWKPGSGPQVTPLRLPDGRRLRVAPLICYDAVVPELAIAAVREGAELIVTLSNDAWFATGEGPHLHLVVSAFRSLETRRSQVRATNTGISAIISPTGELLAVAGVHERGAIVASLAGGLPLRNADARVGGLVRPRRAGRGSRAAGNRMADADSIDRERWGAARFVPGERMGHYESWFQRANHPSRPLAFWIRYTIFCPSAAPRTPSASSGRSCSTARRADHRGEAGAPDLGVPLLGVSGSRAHRAGGALEPRSGGGCRLGRARIAWQLAIGGGERPLLLLPRVVYARRLPRRKARGRDSGRGLRRLARGRRRARSRSAAGAAARTTTGEAATPTATPGARSRGSRAPDAFLECSTARVRVGPVWTPWLTLAGAAGRRARAGAEPAAGLAARHRPDRRLPTGASRAEGPGVRIRGRIEAPARAFVGCATAILPAARRSASTASSRAASSRSKRRVAPRRSLRSENRAAFEILTDEPAPGVPIVA